MNFLSVCSGIEAASVAWNPLGWHAAAFSEIEKFPCAVLDHHYPSVPNWGDMTKYQDWNDANIDLLVGGTPCQSFSVAGLRKGLDDPRGNLMLTYGAIAKRYRPRWLVWENVPGVLSSDKGRDFGTFLGMLAQLGYGFAYRVLDAQYIRVESHARAVPQRRRRVFVVGCLGDWRRAAAVLFERESLQGHTAPRREAGQGSTGGAEIGPSGGRFTQVSPTLDARCKDGPIRNQLAPIAFNARQDPITYGNAAGPIDTDGSTMAFVGERYYTHEFRQDSIHRTNGVADALATSRTRLSQSYHIAPMDVRRLTPQECERLQGFPDDYTLIPYRGKPAADGPRYKALGNSMAVNCMSWIGQRIQLANEITVIESNVA